MGQSFQERMKQVCDLAGGGQQLAEKSGVSRRAIGKYLAGSYPSREILVKLAQAAGVRVEWLATGEGAVLVTAAAGLIVEQPRAGYAYVPLFELAAKGGASGRVVEQERIVDVLAFKEDWIRQELRVRPGDLRLIYVEGDSMEPDLRAGDIILIDHTDTAARREGIYVLRMDGALLVKMLQRLPGGVVKVISRNESYEPFSLKAEELEGSAGIAIVGRVVWACRRF